MKQMKDQLDFKIDQADTMMQEAEHLEKKIGLGDLARDSNIGRSGRIDEARASAIEKPVVPIPSFGTTAASMSVPQPSHLVPFGAGAFIPNQQAHQSSLFGNTLGGVGQMSSGASQSFGAGRAQKGITGLHSMKKLGGVMNSRGALYGGMEGSFRPFSKDKRGSPWLKGESELKEGPRDKGHRAD